MPSAGSKAIDPLVKPWQTGLGDLILGEDALRPENLYQKMFRLTANKVGSLSLYAGMLLGAGFCS